MALKFEHDENEQRKEPTVSEKVALVGAIAEREKWLAEQRMKSGGQPLGNISPGSDTGRVSDIIAQKVGLGSGKTLEAAQKVVEHVAPELVEAMDRKKVSIHAMRRAGFNDE